MLAWQKGVGAPPARVAFCIIQVPDAGIVFEADVLLSEEPATVVGWRKVRPVHTAAQYVPCRSHD